MESAQLSSSWFSVYYFKDCQIMKANVELAAIAVSFITGANGFNGDDQVNPSIPFGSFENPSAHVRPRFR